MKDALNGAAFRENIAKKLFCTAVISGNAFAARREWNWDRWDRGCGKTKVSFNGLSMTS